MSVTLESALFMGKNYSDNQHSIKNTKDLTMKQMFDISAKLVSEQDEIYGVKTIGWEDYSWKYLSLIGDEQVISLHRTKVYVFSDSVLCLGKIHENTQSNTQSLLLKSLVELVLLGPEQRGHPVPMLQQSQCLPVKLGLLESQSRVLHES